MYLLFPKYICIIQLRFSTFGFLPCGIFASKTFKLFGFQSFDFERTRVRLFKILDKVIDCIMLSTGIQSELFSNKLMLVTSFLS